MTLDELMKEKHITKYRLAKESEIPYTTIGDICSGKTNLRKGLAGNNERTANHFVRELWQDSATSNSSERRRYFR